MIPKFHLNTPLQRRQILANSNDTLDKLAGSLCDETAILDLMSENVIGAWRLPLGVLTGLIVNGNEHRIAMATEEPSVIAAASRAARVINASGGISCTCDRPVTQAQILCIIDKSSEISFINKIILIKNDLLNEANTSNPELIKIGGGAIDLTVRAISDASAASMIEIRLDVLTVDAMGANAVNTMAEAIQLRIAREFQSWPGFETGMAILTNAAPGRFVHARVEIPCDTLSLFAQIPGETLASRIELASRFAQNSPERAATHNKGILNGIIAAALPLGQDTRALSAAFFDAACKSGSHRPLSQWTLENHCLAGKIDLPLVVGYVGGFRKNPAVEAAFSFDQIDSYHTLCSILASIGLAQNMAALWALMTDGIQTGHMALHARKFNPDPKR